MSVRRHCVIHEVTYPYPPDRVWEALTEPTALARWLFPNDFRPIVGHCFTFRLPDNGSDAERIACEVVELDALHRLAFTWLDRADRPATLVTFTLQPVAGGTHLRLEHSGFTLAARRQPAARPPDWRSRLSRLFVLEVDTAALTEALLAYIAEPRPDRRNALPVVRELRQVGFTAFPLELLETLVLDGVDQHQAVDELVASLLDRPGVVAMPA